MSSNSYFRECGTIKKVEIINFMCHEHLAVDFSPDITFITGPNGSGKSAILTALQVAFGIRANSTGRANKFDQLIRKGSPNPARIYVHIRNVGPGAYHPEEYKNVIIVERIIRPSSNTIRLLNKDKKVVTDRKRDVMEMLKHFNIKIDNPLVFMEQTTMKQFIQGDDKIKYEVLMQAMNFKSLEQNFNQTDTNLTSMKDMLSRFKKVELLKKQTERDTAREEIQKIKHLENRQQQKTELEKRVYWAEVQEMEKEIGAIQGQIDDIDETISGFKQRIENEEKKQAELDEQVANSKTQIESLQNDVYLQQEENRRSGEEYDAAMQPVLKAKEEYRDAKRNVKGCIRRIQDNRKKISELNIKLQQKANDDKKKRKMERLNSDIEKLTQEKEQYQELRNGIEQNQQSSVVEIEQLKEKEMSVIQEQNRLNKDVHITKKRLDDAKKAENDRRFRYGENMVNLMNQLSRYRSESRIFCPIGDYITLKDEFRPWMNAIETTLDRVLCGAICSVRSQKDIHYLNQLGRKCGVYNFNVIAISYEGDFDIPHLQYPTILEAFEFANPIVRKALISSSSIESVILAKDTDDVLRITGSGRVRQMPTNCKSIVTKNGDTHRVKNGNPNMSANRKQAHGYLAKNSEAMTQRWEAELREKSNQLQAVSSRLSMITSQMESKKREKLMIDRKYSEYETKIREMDRQILRNRAELERIAEDDVDSELASIRNEIDELQKEVEKDEATQREEEGKLEELDARIRSGEEIVKTAKQKSDEIRRKLNETTVRLSRLKNSNELEETINRSKLVITKARESIRSFEASRNTMVIQRDQKQEVINLSVEKLGAETRIMEPLSRRACEIELKRMSEEIESEMHQLGIDSLESVQKRWDEANAAYLKSQNEYKSVKREGEQMEDLNKRQRMSYQELRHEAQQQICKRFTMFLSQRKAEGKVDINHDSKQVSLTVKMDSTNEVAQSQVRNIQLLSGGEKSFVTLSLIMATAHIIESPFFIMDEFDVFMDEANRVVSLHTIIDTARQERRQFIFITPHNLETVVKEMGKEGRNDISIFRLNDHQRARNA